MAASSPGLGSGSEFVVALPLLHERRSKERGEREPAASVGGEARHRRVLIVDDQEDAAVALADYLQQDGHQMLVVNDGPAALAAVASFDPEIVLLDLGLPEMDGYEVARRLRDAYPG